MLKLSLDVEVLGSRRLPNSSFLCSQLDGRELVRISVALCTENVNSKNVLNLCALIHNTRICIGTGIAIAIAIE